MSSASSTCPRDSEEVRGLFVALEGPEGAGKSTLSVRLANRLREQLRASGGRAPDVILTREPGGTPVSDAIRSVLLDPGQQIAPLTEFLLYSASRAQHVVDVIAPALEQGAIVICDRFIASSVAYQGAGRGLDAGFVSDLNSKVAGGCLPDLTILLDVETSTGLERIRQRGQTDRLERADLAFHERVAESFRQQARTGDWLVVDASRDAAEVEQQVLESLEGLVAEWLAG